MFLQNVGMCLEVYMELQPRRQTSTPSLPWEPQFLLVFSSSPPPPPSSSSSYYYYVLLQLSASLDLPNTLNTSGLYIICDTDQP
jgi:hypothetical protein